ncbi:site-specific integrase [Paraburkholderia sp. BL21I4N1]|uniref:site-specific integrase n=1 Tax=Paraburkholderia sp. BL21I4N1 TaxID=1938801 RepID=UPI000CFAD729|nr:site-specific integrase [Paraburkholderia sp. BL21I4N1]PQV48569.1 site-specific recombinase XerD [Paraburkholderia sp. BL21I4N1]
MHKLPHLTKNRFGVYYLRLAHNGQEVKRSLRTKDFRHAKLLALAFNLELAMKTPDDKPKAADFNLDAEALKRLDVIFPDGTQVKDINTDDDVRRAKELFGDRFVSAMAAPLDLPILTPQTMAAIAAQQANSAPKKRGKLFADVVKLYVREKALDNTARTIAAKQGAFDDFVAKAGARAMDAYSLDDAVAYKNRLIEAGGSASRINSKLSYLRDLFAYSMTNGQHPGPNPFENAKVSSKSKLEQQKRSYKPFTGEDLKTIFSPDTYPARMDKPGYRWLPFLALYSGARLEELASLALWQIQRDGDIWFFELVKAKNSNSLRRIPLHATIVESGFLAYVEKTKASGATQLFPELKPGKNGYGKNVTRRFGDYLDDLSITDDRKVFHSFRHTFIARMSARNVHPAMLMALVGHYDQAKVDFSSPHFTNYQHDKTLAELKATIDLFDIQLPLSF